LRTWNATSNSWNDQVWSAASGKRKYQNSQFTNVKGKGPVPEGYYSINLSLDPDRVATYNPETMDMYSNFGIQKIPEKGTNTAGKSYSFPGWGTMRARLEPMKDTETFGRDNFYLHDSVKGYTSGCIETDNAVFGQLMKIRGKQSSIKLKVLYTAKGGSTGGRAGLLK
ncbi:MAG TPA: tlde1 domain-containing protein, partial [Flavisolibacter sp.]|nr:tlde1 domain-containing protein [Flavisolibacter sp.]